MAYCLYTLNNAGDNKAKKELHVLHSMKSLKCIYKLFHGDAKLVN